MTESGSFFSQMASPTTSLSKSNDSVPMHSQPLAPEGNGDPEACVEEAPTSSATRHRCDGRDTWRLCSVIYTACLAFAAVAWMIFHSIFVSRGDNNMTFQPAGSRGKYPWLYAVAFCLPSVDGVVHLMFTLWNVRRRDSGIVAPWNFKFDRPLWTFLLLATSVVSVRFFLIWCVPGTEEGSTQWILAVGSLIEALPHFTPLVLLYERTSKMYPTISTSCSAPLTGQTENEFLSVKSVAAYKQLATFADSKTWNWQFFIVITITSELVIVFVQYLWLIMHPNEDELANIALLTLVEGCYIAFKLWPLVRFNRKVKRFANKLVIKSQQVDDAGFRRAVSTTSILFVTQPPCLKVLGVAVDKTTLVALFLSVTFTSTSSYILKAAKLG